MRSCISLPAVAHGVICPRILHLSRRCNSISIPARLPPDGEDQSLPLVCHALSIGTEAQPSAGVIDSQSVKTTESGGICGFDAGKKVKGRKRHILTDTEGFIVTALVHAADIQDRDGAAAVLQEAGTGSRGCVMSLQMVVMQEKNCAQRSAKLVSGTLRS